MTNIAMVFVGGGLGSLARYLLSSSAYRFFGGAFPCGTLLVNLAGCFVIGLLWALSEKFVIASAVRVFLFVGFLGGFTTFSSFGLETFSLLRDGQLRLALWNILANNVLGLGLVFLGFAIVRFLFR